MSRTKALTDAIVEALPFAQKGQYVVRDQTLRGFFVVVGTQSKTFTIQVGAEGSAGTRSSRRKSIGRFGTLTTRGARTLAKNMVGELIAAEAKPKTLPIQPLTLSVAWERYQQFLQEHQRSERTIAGYKHHIENYFNDWLSVPLLELANAPDRVDKRHRDLTINHGAYAANGGMRTFSAIYNNTARTALELRRLNPVEAVRFNREHRRQTALNGADLPDWFSELDRFENKVRRYFHMITLVTGSRPDALKRSKWSDVDVEKGVWHFPNPKGGDQRAFDVPLSEKLIQLLGALKSQAQKDYPASSTFWVFPGQTTPGHITDTKEPRKKLSKWGNDLRQSFRTFATMAGVAEIYIRVLMNHKDRDVSTGYLNLYPIWPELIRAQTLVIAKIENEAKRSILE